MENIYFKDSKIPETLEGTGTSSPELFSVLRTALHRQCKAKILYQDAEGRGRSRKVIPVVFFAYEKIWYMTAFCFLRNNFRTFCFHRVLKAELTPEKGLPCAIPETILQNPVPWNCSLSPDPEKNGADSRRSYTSVTVHIPAKRDRRTKRLFDHLLEGASCEVILADLEEGADLFYRDSAGENILFSAAFFRDPDRVRLLVEQGADPHCCSFSGKTLLMEAASAGNTEILHYFAEECQCKADAVDEQGKNVLFYVLECDSTCEADGAIFRYLIGKGADPFQISSNGSLLKTAVRRGRASAVRFLLEECHFPVRKDSPAGGEDLLFEALLLKDESLAFRIVRLLLQHGADPCSTQEKTSLLMAAMKNRKKKILHFLVEQKFCRINKKNASNRSVLFLALEYGEESECLDMVRFLLDHGADPFQICRGRTFLMEAVFWQRKSVFRYLLENHKCRTDRMDPDNRNVLFYLLKYDPDPENLRLLWKYGKKLLHVDRYGSSPLLYAVKLLFLRDSKSEWYCKLLQCIDFLLAADKKAVNLPDNSGLTPAMYGSGTVLKKLLKYGADPEAVDERGNAVIFHHAASLYDLEILARCGADMHKTDPRGNNLLLRGKIEFHFCRRLIRRFGFSVNSANCKGTTILHLACMAGDLDLIHYLLIHGADPGKANDSGVTPEELLEDLADTQGPDWCFPVPGPVLYPEN